MASIDLSEMMVMAQCGGKAGVKTVSVHKSNTICAHAMAVGDRLFIVEDTLEDERFKALPTTLGRGFACTNDGERFRFYASAPIYLSTPSIDPRVPEEKVLVGRLCVLDGEPRTFGAEDQALLREIARMTEDSLESEFRGLLARKNKRIQSTLGYLASSMDDSSVLGQCSDITAAASEEETPLAADHNICPRRSNLICQSARRMLGAQSAFVVDVSAIEGQRGDMSRRASRKGSTYPSMPWLNDDASPHTSRSSFSSPTQSSFDRSEGPSPSPSASHISFGSFDNTGKQDRAYRRSSDSPRASFDAPSLHSVLPETSLPRLMAYDGVKGKAPRIATQLVARELQLYMQTHLMSGPAHERMSSSPGSQVRFFSAKTDDTLYENDQEHSDVDVSETSSTSPDSNPLRSILPDGTAMYAAVPVYNSDRSKVVLLIIIAFSEFIALDDTDVLFIAATGSILSSSIIRQEAAAVARAQIRFIQQIQHELRTPLHGVLGVTEFLRHAIPNKQLKVEADKTGLSEEDFLMRLLEMIRLGGRTLANLLDDVLDFGTVSGVRDNSLDEPAQEGSTSSQSVDLFALVEEVCEGELQVAEMVHRQQDIASPETHPTMPHFFVKIHDDVRDYLWAVPVDKLRKALSKVLANALRFTPGPGIVILQVKVSETQQKETQDAGEVDLDFLVADSGVGMSEAFLRDGFLKPFVKYDSFTQGVGLGMTLAASLLKEMRGHLHVASRIKEGTQINLTIPAKRTTTAPRQAAPVEPSAVRSVHFQTTSSPADREIRRMLLRYFSARGIAEVASSKDADLLVATQEACNGADSPPIHLPSLARVILAVNANLSSPEPVAQFKGRPVHIWRPPFGPKSLLQLDTFVKTPHASLSGLSPPIGSPTEQVVLKPPPRPQAKILSEERVEMVQFTSSAAGDASLRETEFKVLVVEVSIQRIWSSPSRFNVDTNSLKGQPYQHEAADGDTQKAGHQARRGERRRRGGRQVHCIQAGRRAPRHLLAGAGWLRGVPSDAETPAAARTAHRRHHCALLCIRPRTRHHRVRHGRMADQAGLASSPLCRSPALADRLAARSRRRLHVIIFRIYSYVFGLSSS